MISKALTQTSTILQASKIMQCIKSSVLRHIRLQTCLTSVRSKYSPQLCTLAGDTDGQIMDRVISLVRNFNKSAAAKVTETASFHKDLCLDSLERVELVMALEQEFSVEIPEGEADKLLCCSDVAKYISSVSKQSTAQKS